LQPDGGVRRLGVSGLSTLCLLPAVVLRRRHVLVVHRGRGCRRRHLGQLQLGRQRHRYRHQSPEQLQQQYDQQQPQQHQQQQSRQQQSRRQQQRQPADLEP